MANNIHHFKGFSIVDADIRVNLDMSRISKQMNDAQYLLDTRIMTDMVPRMPKQTGTFIHVTEGISQSLAGTGIVCAAAPPMGRYLYEGKVMVDKETGKGPMKIPNGPGEYILRFRKGAVLKAINRPLQYSTHAHPDVTDHWFDATKKLCIKEWVEIVQETTTGG